MATNVAPQMPVSLNMILDQVAKDKGIERSVLIDTLQNAIAQAAKKHFGLDRAIEARYDEEKGVVEVFQTLTVVQRVEIEDPIKSVNQISLEDAGKKGIEAEIGDELLFQNLLPARGQRRGAGAGRALRRHPAPQDAPKRIWPHRRADRQAGDHPAHPRRRARERLQRLQGSQERDRLRRGAAVRARQHHRQPRPRRSRAAGARADAARELPRRRSRAGLCASTCSARARARRSCCRAARPSW